jgi:hypothetical protein
MYKIIAVTTLQCNICPTLTHDLSSYSEMVWTQGFLRTCLGGGASTKRDRTILSVERWWDGCWWQKVWCGIICTSGGGGYFSTPRTEMWAFSETDFWIYHNWVTQEIRSLLNLVGLTPMRHYHGWRRAGKFWKFWVSRSLEMAFSESLALWFVSLCCLWL